NRTPAGKRKLRLFLCSCFRCLWEYLPDPRSRGAVELAERMEDGPADLEEINGAEEAAQAVQLELQQAIDTQPDARVFVDWFCSQVSSLARASLHPDPWRVARATARHLDDLNYSNTTIGVLAGPDVRANLVRELFGNPFSPVVPDTDWLEWHDGI